MGYPDRRDAIQQLEAARGSRVLGYVLSDRETFPGGIPGFGTNLATEPQLLLAERLHSWGRVPKIDLFLYTRGGATESVWPLVTLLREHCDRLEVIVPFRAHSGGTLICLGADGIVMTEAAELSPIDPTTGNQFNPTDPANPQNRFGISVEDVAAYFELSKERVGITEQPYKVEVFKDLTRTVHPLALGNVQRVYMQIRRLARSLLALHLNEEAEDERIKSIVTALTERFYSHVHAISRREAQALLGEWVKAPTPTEEPLIWSLLGHYVDALHLRDKFNLPEYMADQPSRDLTAHGAFLEATDFSLVHVLEMKVLQRPNLPPNVQIQVPAGSALPLVPWVVRTYDWGIQKLGWRTNDEGI